MVTTDATAFLDRVDSDSVFADRLAAVGDDPSAVRAILAAEGFDLDPVAVRDAFLERYGSQLTEEQLAAISGGQSNDVAGGIIVGSVIGGFGALIGLGAAAAAV